MAEEMKPSEQVIALLLNILDELHLSKLETEARLDAMEAVWPEIQEPQE